jgi:hypothetical protein
MLTTATTSDCPTCYQCGEAIAGPHPHVCFTRIAALPVALCACGQPAAYTHVCHALTVPQMRYPATLGTFGG